MIGAVIRRTLVDLWDNAVAVFALNLAVLGLAALVLYVLSLAQSAGPGVVMALLIAATGAGLALVAAMGGLVEQIAARADIEPRRLLPDLAFCFLAAPALCGMFALSGLLLEPQAGGSAFSVARVIGGLWLLLLPLQAMVIVPALALDRSRPALAKLAWLLMLMARFPLQATALVAFSAVAMVATVGLLPGPAGIAYLYLRAGRLMATGCDPARDRPLLSAEEWNEALAAETQTLKNRTPRNLLQPWRPAS